MTLEPQDRLLGVLFTGLLALVLLRVALHGVSYFLGP